MITVVFQSQFRFNEFFFLGSTLDVVARVPPGNLISGLVELMSLDAIDAIDAIVWMQLLCAGPRRPSFSANFRRD